MPLRLARLATLSLPAVVFTACECDDSGCAHVVSLALFEGGAPLEDPFSAEITWSNGEASTIECPSDQYPSSCRAGVFGFVRPQGTGAGLPGSVSVALQARSTTFSADDLPVRYRTQPGTEALCQSCSEGQALFDLAPEETDDPGS